jgi:hypothetical protein
MVAGKSLDWFNTEEYAVLETELKVLIESEWTLALSGMSELLGPAS